MDSKLTGGRCALCREKIHLVLSQTEHQKADWTDFLSLLIGCRNGKARHSLSWKEISRIIAQLC